MEILLSVVFAITGTLFFFLHLWEINIRRERVYAVASVASNTLYYAIAYSVVASYSPLIDIDEGVFAQLGLLTLSFILSLGTYVSGMYFISPSFNRRVKGFAVSTVRAPALISEIEASLGSDRKPRRTWRRGMTWWQRWLS